MRAGAAFVIAFIVGCGGGGPSGPQPLVPDPAVQDGCVPGPVGAGQTRAKVVACDEELIGGRLAGGRIGDFLLENERVRVIVRGPGEGFYLHGTAGGGLVDAASAGGEDLIKEIQPAIDLTAGAFDELVITEAGDDGAAELVVRGPATGIEIITAALAHEPPDIVVEHHYRLPAGATAVELETRAFSSTGGEPVSHDLYEAMFLGGRARAFLPGHGFEPGQVGADVIATDGTTSSYGLVYPGDTALPQLIDLAGIRLVLGPSVVDNAPGVIRQLVIGDGSVASVTEAGWTLRGIALGTVAGTTAPGIDVAIDSDGVPITVARADAAGAYRAAVPPGDYVLHADAPGRRTPGTPVAATVTAGQATAADVPAGASGTLTLTVRDDAGTAVPARVVLEQAGLDERIEYVGATGDATLALAPGSWRVAVSRGVEYDAVIADPVVIADGQTAPLAAVLDHVVDTAGWISLDTHLHCELSTDSTFPVDDRVRAVAAEGVEVPVSSDHDFITDYTPVIAELGLDGWLATLVGEEASSLVWGHLNGFPLAVDPARTGRGAAHWLARTPGEVFAALHGAAAGEGIVQANHPRKDSNSLFDAIDLDPATLTANRDPTALGLPATADLQDLSFDAVEVANTLSDDDFEEVFADYLALVTAGHPAAATGSSDSHGASRFAGGARTYVWVGAGADDPATVDPAAIVAGIRARHVVVATGAFVTAGIVTGTAVSLPGDTVDVTGRPQVRLHVTVQAAPWQSLASIRIFEHTQQVQQIALDPDDTAPVRYDADITLPAPTADTFWVVRVDPAAEGQPVIHNLMPSFTNPVFASVTP